MQSDIPLTNADLDHLKVFKNYNRIYLKRFPTYYSLNYKILPLIETFLLNVINSSLSDLFSFD